MTTPPENPKISISSDGAKENLSMQIREQAVALIKDYWAIILIVIFIFGWIFTEIYNHHGRISRLEGQLEIIKNMDIS